MPSELTTGVPSFLIWLRPSDNLLATASSCHQLWLMNCDILLLCLSLFARVSLSSRSIDYWNALLFLPFSTRPGSFSLSSPLCSFPSLCPCSLSSPCAVLYLVPFIWLIWYLELIELWIEAPCFHIHLSPSSDLYHSLSHSLSPFSLPPPSPSLSLFFPRVAIMKSGSSPFICISGICGSKRD